MKIALYARVSKDDQKPENQKIILEEHAQRQGWDYDYFEERESTRKTRPIKARLLQDLRAKKYAGVCISRLDRWARSTIELATEVKELYEKGIRFICISPPLDLGSATGRLQFIMFAAFAEFERDLIQERTREGLARAREQGIPLGRPKGSKDKKERRKSGYYLRYAKGGKHEGTGQENNPMGFQGAP